MGRLFGFMGLLAAVAAGAYIYSHQAQATAMGTNTPRAVVDVVGVRNDLLAIAQAERRRFALEGKYATIDELMSSGDLLLPAKGRGPYTYEADLSATGFRIQATCAGGPAQGCASRGISVDETLQVQSE